MVPRPSSEEKTSSSKDKTSSKDETSSSEEEEEEEKKTSDFTVLNSLNGQMFVISFHIISKDEIRCYLFYQGQCFRFYGEDLINVLPLFFVDSKKARDIVNQIHHEKK